MLYCLIHMTPLSFPNTMTRYTAGCASSTRDASLPYSMFLTSIFKYFNVKLEGEEGLEVKSMIEGRQVKPLASPRRSTKEIAAEDKGKSPFIEISNDDSDPNFIKERIFKHKVRGHSSTSKKLTHTCHMLRQLTKELQTFIEM